MTAFDTRQNNPSGPGADPNQKTLDGLTASEIKKAAGPMCKTLPRESLSPTPMRIEKFLGKTRKELAL